MKKEKHCSGAGALPSPPDKRDWNISRCMELPSGEAEKSGFLPLEYNVPWLPEIKNQGSVNSCTAFALAAIFECIHHKLCGECRQSESPETAFSTGFLYGNRRETEYHGMGQYMRDAVKGAAKYGDVASSVWDGNVEVPEAIRKFEAAYPEIYSYARKYIRGYVRLNSAEEAKAFLFRYGIPLFVNTKIRCINPLSHSEGLHAVICTGWKSGKSFKGYFKNQNSWGKYKCPHPQLKFEDYEEVWGLIPMEEKNFNDVQNDRWSAEAIKTAAADGIIEGFPDGSFAPEGTVTREQMAVMWERIKRYCAEHYEENK